MPRLAIVLALALATAGIALADSAQHVVAHPAVVAGLQVSPLHPLSLDASAASTFSALVDISASSAHSVGAWAEVTAATTVPIEVQYSDDSGATWASFQPAITATLSLSDVAPRTRAAVTIPTVASVRLVIGASATIPVTYYDVSINGR